MKEHLGRSGCPHLSVQRMCTWPTAGDMCCPHTFTPVSLILLVLLGWAIHGRTCGSRRDGGLPPGIGGFRWLTGPIQAIRECTCHHRSYVKKGRGLLRKGKSNLRKCYNTYINLSICYYYYENLFKVLV